MPQLKVIGLRVPKNILALAASAQGTYQSSITEALREVRDSGVKTAQSKTPIGAGGDLRAEVFGRLLPFGVRIVWPTVYAGAVQYGTPPHLAPIGRLIAWVSVKLGEDERVAYKIRATIARKGTRAAHYLEEARSAVFLDVVPKFRARVAVLAKLLSGNL